MSDPRLARPLWRGRTNVDALTAGCVEHAEQIGGHEFVTTQGSYQSSVSASAGTHDLGGAVDLRWCGHDACIRALRQAGMAAWHRTPAQGPWPDHIHAVVVGHPLLSPSAANQITAYLNGRNGLANNATDDGPRLNPIPRPVWPWPPAPKGLTMDDKVKAAFDRINERLDKIAAEVTQTRQRLNELGKGERARDREAGRDLSDHREATED